MKYPRLPILSESGLLGKKDVEAGRGQTVQMWVWSGGFE